MAAGHSGRADTAGQPPVAAPARPAGQALPGGRSGRLRQDDVADPVARGRGRWPGGLGLVGRGRQRPHTVLGLCGGGAPHRRAGRRGERAGGPGAPERGPGPGGPAGIAQRAEHGWVAAVPGPGRLPPDHQPDLPPDPDLVPGPPPSRHPRGAVDPYRPAAAPGQDASQGRAGRDPGRRPPVHRRRGLGPAERGDGAPADNRRRGAPGRADRGLGGRAGPGRPLASRPAGPERLHRRLPRRQPPRRRLPGHRGAGPPAGHHQEVPAGHLDPGAPVRSVVRRRPGDERVGRGTG